LNEIEDCDEWDRALESFEFVPPGQAASWSATRSPGGRETLRFASAKAGAVAVQGAFKRSLGVRRFIAEDGPIIGKACDEQTFIDFIAALCERLGTGCLLSVSSVQPYDPVHEMWFRKAGFRRPWSTAVSPLTLYLDCSGQPAPDAGFTADWRKNIRRAERKDLVFEAIGLADPSARRDLLAIYSETFRIKGAVEQIDAPTLHALARNSRWQVFFASHAGKRMSARMVFVSGDMAFDHVAGTNAEGRNLSASHFLMASVLRHLGQSGVRLFDFGRIGPGRYDSIDHFKRGSGGRPVAYLGEWSLSSRPWLELALAVLRFVRGRERW
jgi:hypothetical protein